MRRLFLFGLILALLATTVVAATYDPRYDVDGDGTITTADQSAAAAYYAANLGATRATPVPPTASAVPTHAHTVGVCGESNAAWHPPVINGCATGHEHGDAPPQWVLDSTHKPFMQHRENHPGYKGVFARDRGGRGVQSYFIGHILSTAPARSHGDHDYQVWVRQPDNGSVHYWEGMLDFGTPPPLRLSDTGQRPLIFSVNDGGCETWYSRPGAAVLDVGWTICGRVDTFDGRHLGVGTFRTIDWVMPASRLPAALRPFTTTEFGVARLSFIVNSRQYPSTGVVAPN